MNKKYENIAPLPKSKLSRVEALISESLISLNVTHDELLLINKRARRYEKRNQKLKDLKNL